MKSSPYWILLAALALGACNQEAKAPAPAPRPVLSTVLSVHPVVTQTFVGTVEARVETNLAFQVLGQLVARNVKAGDIVHKGDVLAAIDPTSLELTVRTATANLASSQAELDNALASFDRIDKLKASGTASNAVWENARTQRDAAEAGFRQAQSTLTKARDALTFATLTAAFDGVVTATAAEVGQTVAAGAPVLTIADPSERDAVIDVPDWHVESYRIGQPFQISLRIDPDVKATGHLREIAPQADSLTRTRRIKIALDAPNPAFRLGTIIAAVPDVNDATVMQLPQSAILERGGKTYVWLITDDTTGDTATVSAREVKISPNPDGSVTILSGLDIGARVATAGVRVLTEGQKVQKPGDRS
ncbi:efflux RND transporter periplasmic adaptor subunit [Oryzibacter oryziterrae]|uniref:efflux RND transporter periplasmic adaptor subunit n=1 Tax=Oryzibacter oryziterrae TaxID=2766474 RepID=UPI001F007AD9|nr:efflux RND transporter periplasmic adaptor subunit [Oryzibacter oryziterrae]